MLIDDVSNLGRVDEIPSNCSFNEGTKCSHLSDWGLCNGRWEAISQGEAKSCPSTNGLVKDNCAVACGPGKGYY